MPARRRARFRDRACAWCFAILVVRRAECRQTPADRDKVASAGLVSFGWVGRRSACRAPSSSRTRRSGEREGAALGQHAGETTGPETIWGIDPAVQRRADRARPTSPLRTPRCSTYLAEQEIPIEVCPTHPHVATAPWRSSTTIDRGDARCGVVVTINSDDPPHSHQPFPSPNPVTPPITAPPSPLMWAPSTYYHLHSPTTPILSRHLCLSSCLLAALTQPTRSVPFATTLNHEYEVAADLSASTPTGLAEPGPDGRPRKLRRPTPSGPAIVAGSTRLRSHV